jgi:hypothetical protein
MSRLPLTTGEQRHVDRVTLFGEVGPDRLGAFWPELVAWVEKAKQAQGPNLRSAEGRL